MTSLKLLKARATAGAVLPGDAAIRKQFAASPAIDAENHVATFTASSGAVDRHGDRIAPSGWKLEAYRENPVVLLSHDYQSLPIARCLSIETVSDRLVARVEFDPADALAMRVFEKIKTGFMSAVSVGFRPLAWAWSDDPTRKGGWDISSSELLELSVVAIPANADALLARAADPETATVAGTRRRAEVARLRLRC